MDGEGSRGEMTLLITVAAIERFADPRTVVADARQWSTRVGVVGDAAPDEVRNAIDRTGVDPDFVSGTKGTTGSLAAVRQRFPTDRYVVIGTNDEVRKTAQALGWEYLPIEDAAEKAEWEIDESASPN
jgi:hypothetical protein